jgi:tol-pal system protein YbgF
MRSVAIGLVLLSPLIAQAQSTRTLVEEMGLRVERLEQIVQGQALLEMLQRIETLSALSREQRGEIDLLSRELQTLREQQRAVTVDQERRLAALEREWAEWQAQRVGSTPSTVSEVTPTAATSGSEPSGSPVGDETSGNQASGDETTTSTPPRNAPPATVSGSDSTETAEVLYARALASLNAGNYPASIAAFEVFLQRHAEHSLADNARYWMGQAYFLLRDYARALEFFEKVSAEIADVGKAADTWLKRGLCELELERLPAAKRSFETVASRYPDSAAAPLARQALSRLDMAAADSNPQ